jgi:hypothetical protein
MLGFTPCVVEDLDERIEIFSSAGDPIHDGAQPWRRAARSEPFEEEERWRDRATGAELVLRVRGRGVAGGAALV